MHPRRSFWKLPSAMVLVLATASACAHTEVAPLRLRAGDFRPSTRAAPGQAVILDFKAGDRVPVTIQVSGELVETTPSPSVVWLTAKRDFSLRIRGAELKTSLDGVHFDEKPAAPGRFQVALMPTPDGGPTLRVTISTPVHGRP